MKSLISILCIILFFNTSCKNELSYNSIAGEWKVEKFDISSKDTKFSQTILDNANEIAMSTSYIFNKDSTFAEIMIKNSVTDFSFKYSGDFSLDIKNRILTTNVKNFQVLETDDKWKDVEKNEFNNDIFKSIEYKITKYSSNTIIMTMKNGYNDEVGYTLKRIN